MARLKACREICSILWKLLAGGHLVASVIHASIYAGGCSLVINHFDCFSTKLFVCVGIWTCLLLYYHFFGSPPRRRRLSGMLSMVRCLFLWRASSPYQPCLGICTHYDLLPLLIIDRPSLSRDTQSAHFGTHPGAHSIPSYGNRGLRSTSSSDANSIVSRLGDCIANCWLGRWKYPSPDSWKWNDDLAKSIAAKLYHWGCCWR